MTVRRPGSGSSGPPLGQTVLGGAMLTPPRVAPPRPPAPDPFAVLRPPAPLGPAPRLLPRPTGEGARVLALRAAPTPTDPITAALAPLVGATPFTTALTGGR